MKIIKKTNADIKVLCKDGVWIDVENAKEHLKFQTRKEAEIYIDKNLLKDRWHYFIGENFKVKNKKIEIVSGILTKKSISTLTQSNQSPKMVVNLLSND